METFINEMVCLYEWVSWKQQLNFYSNGRWYQKKAPLREIASNFRRPSPYLNVNSNIS